MNGLNLIEVLQQSTPVTKAVLAILLIFSIWSWGIILSKTLLFRKIHRESETFWKMFRRGKSLSEISTALESLRFTPLVPVFNAAAERSGKTSALALQRTVQRAAAAQLTRLRIVRRTIYRKSSEALLLVRGKATPLPSHIIGHSNVRSHAIQDDGPGSSIRFLSRRLAYDC